jgi:predicted extracellular nuclease
LRGGSTVGPGPTLSYNPGRLLDTNLADGDAFADSRKPLVAHFLFNRASMFVVANHFNSKGGDQGLFGPSQPPTLISEAQRRQQASIVRNFADQLLAEDARANVVVLGDLNDFPFSG